MRGARHWRCSPVVAASIVAASIVATACSDSDSAGGKAAGEGSGARGGSMDGGAPARGGAGAGGQSTSTGGTAPGEEGSAGEPEARAGAGGGNGGSSARGGAGGTSGSDAGGTSGGGGPPTGGSGGAPASTGWQELCLDGDCAFGSPAPRQGATAAFDAVRGEVVMYGGETEQGAVAETWIWDGTSWTERCPMGACATLGPRSAAALVYDPAAQQIVLFGGNEDVALESCRSDTFAWDGTTWTSLATDFPSARFSPGLAYDTARSVLVLFGGTCDMPLADTYERASEWQDSCTDSACAATTPSPRLALAMAYDEARGVTVLFGGTADGGVSDETWTWNGSAWTLLDPATRPSGRSGARMVYDSNRQRLVLFGGTNNTEVLADTWEWDGTDWHLLAVDGPLGRHRAAMAYDSARRRVVLFGGVYDPSTSAVTFMNDTWELAVE